MLDPFNLLRQLADGRFHSGQHLANRYGVSRMTIYNAIHRLMSAGIGIDALPGRGYRLKQQIELLNDWAILENLNTESKACISGLEVFVQIDSTNSHLMREAHKGAPSGRVCLAELQTSGKGRRGRGWVSPFGLNLYMSLLWRFENCSGAMSGLSLLIGLGLAKVLESFGVIPMTLKWPNDLVHKERKLGGILLEIAGELDGRCYVVIGVGINFNMPHQHAKTIAQPWTDLTRILSGPVPSRNVVAARVIESIVGTIHYFERDGLAGLPAQWHRYDSTAGRLVALHTPSGIQRGYGGGVDELGRFILEEGGQRRIYASGDVSLRS